MEIQTKELRIKINKVLFRKFKILCYKKDLSAPKQVAELIRKLVEVEEETERRMSHLGK